MRFVPPALLLLLLAPLLFAAPPAGAPAGAATAPKSDHAIADPMHDPAWRGLFERLAPQRARYSKFEERRLFPFRRTPIVLEGEIRILPQRGISLSYGGDDPHLVIVDAQGILLRDAQGRDRGVPNDRRAEAATSALFDVLRFDLPALTREFGVHGLQDGDDWVLGFDPKDPTVANFIGSIIIQGHGSQLDHIAMIRSEKQRIDITIRETHNDVTFSPDELRRYFR